MKHIITVETKKEIEINYPHFFKVEKKEIDVTYYYAAVSENYAIVIYSTLDINTYNSGSVIIHHVGSVGYKEINSDDFNLAMVKTFEHIRNKYSEEINSQK